MMAHVPVKSSLIKSVGYDPETEHAEISFATNGKTYNYRLTQDEYDALMGAESIGKHFNEFIRGKEIKHGQRPE